MPARTPEGCVESFVAALIRRDMAAALALLTDDAVLFYSNGLSIWGKDAFAAAIMANWKRMDGYSYTTRDAGFPPRRGWLAHRA